jgi:hypothetical protein
MTIEIDVAAPQASQSAVSWPAVLAGAFVAGAVSLVFLALGTGLGLAVAPPWLTASSAAAFTLYAGIWLIVTQWAASGVGGYIAGRLRTRWSGVHAHEVFFRDTAHGFLSWAVATVGVAVLAVAVAGLGAAAGGPEAAVRRDVDTMFHLAGATAAQVSQSQRDEAGRILAAVGVKAPPAADRAALADLVASAGAPAAQAQQRADAAIAAVHQRSEAARKSAAGTAIFTAIAMLIGAFIASVTAALGGRLRDEHP